MLNGKVIALGIEFIGFCLRIRVLSKSLANVKYMYIDSLKSNIILWHILLSYENENVQTKIRRERFEATFFLQKQNTSSKNRSNSLVSMCEINFYLGTKRIMV